MIATKKAVATTTHKRHVEQFTDAGRTGFTAQCPQCKEEYVVYYGQKMDEAEARKEFDNQMERGHNHTPASHPESFALGEKFPDLKPDKK
jgi:hypothetical protein